MMMRRHVYPGIAALAAALLFGAAQLGAKAPSHDWPQFRGPNRDAVSTETGLLTAWPESGPKEVFRVPLGEGYSGISVVDGKAYTMFAAMLDEQPTEFAAAFDAATGKELWRTPVGKRFDLEFGGGPRATPTVDDGMVYVLGAAGGLAALSAKDGGVVWKLELTEAFGAPMPIYGFATSVLVDDGQVIVECGGGEGKSYAGLNKKTGEVNWTSGDGRPGYNSPLVVQADGKRQYVYISGGKLRSIDAAGGENWSLDWPRGETHAIPIWIAPDRIFASGAEPVGGHMFRVGESSAKELWQNNFVRVHFNAGVAYGDHIYTFDNATLKCIRAEDAKLAWAKRGLGKGSMIYADGHLYVLSDQGELVLIEATPEGYRETGRVTAFEPSRCWTAPSLAGGKLYLRNHVEMVAYDVKG